MRKKPRVHLDTGLLTLLEELFLVFPGGLRLLAALDARALVVLALAHFGQDSGLGATALKTLQRIVQGLALFYVDFRH